MRVPLFAVVMRGAVTSLILTACHSDSTAPGVPAAATAITKLGIDPASVIAGTSFSDSIRVLVSDASNNPMSGVGVAFAVTAGGGSVSPTAAITDGNGRAASKFITGTTVGANSAAATVTGLAPVMFSIITIATPPPLVWSSVSSGTTAPINLYDIWGTSASDIWAVGGTVSSGTILHYDGTAWSPAWNGANAINSVWGRSANDVWAVGDAGTILHYNGSAWSSVSSGTTQGLGSVWAASASDVWAAGGFLLHFNGTTWSIVPSGTIRPVSRIWGSSASDVWAVAGDGSGGEILHYNGSVWSGISTGFVTFNDVFGTSASDVWTVGYDGAILHYNGFTWSSFSSGTQQMLFGVWASSGADVWAVGGANRIILHYNGFTWSTVYSGTTSPNFLYGIWGSSSSDVWAIGGGTILHGTPAG